MRILPIGAGCGAQFALRAQLSAIATGKQLAKFAAVVLLSAGALPIDARENAPMAVAQAPSAFATAVPQARGLLDVRLVELPRVEELLPGQTLVAFMQPRVPMGLRAAAMRRMWLIDPAISDYVNPATDYAEDYNAPGGTRSSMPLVPPPEMIEAVNAMFSRPAEDHHFEPVRASTGSIWPWLRALW